MLETVIMYAGIVIACLIAVLNIIAPLTKSDLDNKALDFLRWLESTVLRMILPMRK
jgi:hypothetical protein